MAPAADPAASTAGAGAAAMSLTDKGEFPLNLKPFTVVHYRDDKPFPEFFDDDFPTEAYRSRFGEVKTAVHWGQRKLLLSEIQLLAKYAKEGVSYHIVYAGSAPGTHLGFLDDLFERVHTWELVDPGRFDVAVLGPRKNFKLRNEFFTNMTAYGIAADRMRDSGLPALATVYEGLTVHSGAVEARTALQSELQEKVGTLDVARGTHDIPSMYEPEIKAPLGLRCLFGAAMSRKPTMFVSDIRTGSVAHSNFEDHVDENMRAQQCWTEIIQADYSMLKFRLPYTKKTAVPGYCTEYVASHLIDADGTVEYLRGDMLIPIWTRPTSTEGRLVVPAGAHRTRWNVQRYEDQCFYFNARVREVMHFNHMLAPHSVFDGHYDSAAEIVVLEQFVRQVHFRRPEVKANNRDFIKKQIEHYVAKITQHLRINFTDAIRRRDALIGKMAAMGITSNQFYDDEEEGGGATATAAAGSSGENAGATASTDGAAAASAEAPLFLAPTQRVWVKEAKKLVAAAHKERSRMLWMKNYVVPAERQVPSDMWNCIKMPQ